MGNQKSAKQKQRSSQSAAAAKEDPFQFWLRLGLGVLLFVVLLASYSDSFDGPFLLDNQQIILMDTRLQAADWGHVQSIFTKDYWWPTLASDLYRPITTLTYWFNYSILGNQGHPQGYHIINFLLHAINVWLVYALLREMGTKKLVAYWAAAIYGLHPVATEAVANIVGRADLLVTFFVLSAMLCYIRSVKVPARYRGRWLLGLGVLSVLGVISKESGVMILPAMFFYDWLFRNHPDQAPLPNDWKARLRILVPDYLVIAPALLTFVGVRAWMTFTSPTYGNPFVDNPIELAGFYSGRMTAFKVLGQYCGMLIWPSVLSCDWSYNQIPLYGPDAPFYENIQSWIAIVLVISLLVLAWAARKRYSLLTFGIIWFFVAVFPTSNLPITIGSIKGERLLYLPALGFALIAAMGIERLRLAIAECLQPPRLFLRVFSFILPLCIFTAFGIRTYFRNDDWSSEYKLWSSAVRTCPNSFKTYKGFSNYFIGKNTEEGADQAIAVAERGMYVLEHPPLPIERMDNTLAINIAFHYARKAELCSNRGARDEAMAYYSKALGALDKAMLVDHYANKSSRAKFIRLGKSPDDIRDVGNPTVYELRAAVFIGMNRLQDAVDAAQYNLRLNPFSVRGNMLLAEVFARQNNYDRASVYWIRALLLDANAPGCWQNLERAYSILSPDRPALRTLPNGTPSLMPDNPVVRRQLTQACIENYNIMVDTLRFDEARGFRDKAIQAYGCPPELFPTDKLR